MIKSLSNEEILISLILFCLVFVCGNIAVSDFKIRKIPNKQLIILILLGILLKALTATVTSFSIDLSVGFLIVLLTFPMFVFKKLGAGDIKFLGVSLFLCGSQLLPEFFTVLLVSSIVISVVAFSETVRFAWLSFVELTNLRLNWGISLDRNSVPYGVPIAISTSFCLLIADMSS